MKSDNLVLMPPALTVENGAKALLDGQFIALQRDPCACLVDDDGDCDGDCDEGFLTVSVPVSWTTIQAIYAMAVKHLGVPK